MENIILLVHLIIAIFLIGVVLLQRSDGGALGIGGGGGGLSTGRPPATPLQKVTWTLAAAFIATSLVLTAIATRMNGGDSVIDGAAPIAASGEAPVTAPDGGSLLPPSLGDGPLTPPTDGPVAPPPAQ